MVFVGSGVRLNGSVFVTMDQHAIANLTRPAGMVDVYTKGKAGAVKVAARQIAPVKSGRLRDSIQVRQSRDVKGRYSVGYEVEATAPYSVFVHEGTRPHEITPVNASVLAFDVGGTTVFAHRVNHPGTKANPFLVRATQSVFAGSR